LIARYGPSILRTARRYSLSLEDAEDAYQRALEILLTKAPTTREAELLPWLKTVVKHEAFALRRQRRRTGASGDDGLGEIEAPDPSLAEQVEQHERLRLGAEALKRLKPQEVRCLLLRAEGHSYKQICAETGWSYTKVNRCLTEGRRTFAERVAGIEAGAECQRLAPLLSALADGEASADDALALRTHLRSCLGCRATLREFRSTPSRVAALLPVALLDGEHDDGSLGRALESIWGWTHDRIAAATLKAQAASERAHQLAEAATAQKVAAVAASTAALAGGVATLPPKRDAVGPQRSGQRPLTARAAPHQPHRAAPLTSPTESPTTDGARTNRSASSSSPSPAPAASIEFGAGPSTAAASSAPAAASSSGGGEFVP